MEDQYKAGILNEPCPYCKSRDCCYVLNEVQSKISALQALVDESEKDFKWIRQTIHQAHHDGEIEQCRKNTCDSIRQSLLKIHEARRGT